MDKIKELAEAYEAVVEISKDDALKNAEYIFKNVIVQDESKVSYIGDSLQPIIKVIEYIENPEKTQMFIDYIENHGKEPKWANDEDFGLKGKWLPYLAATPEEHKTDEIYYVIVERSGYNDEKGKEALMVSRILHIEDLKEHKK